MLGGIVLCLASLFLGGGGKARLKIKMYGASGSIHTGRGTQRAMPRKQMEPVDVNGSVHTAGKQH